jgi:Cdc6-like AAA superfamily ATPase
MCSMIRRISCKSATTSTNHLEVNGITIEQPTEIANSLASTISHNSSSDHYTETLQRYKAHQEKHILRFTSDNLKSYNTPF